MHVTCQKTGSIHEFWSQFTGAILIRLWINTFSEITLISSFRNIFCRHSYDNSPCFSVFETHGWDLKAILCNISSRKWNIVCKFVLLLTFHWWKLPQKYSEEVAAFPSSWPVMFLVVESFCRKSTEMFHSLALRKVKILILFPKLTAFTFLAHCNIKADVVFVPFYLYFWSLNS